MQSPALRFKSVLACPPVVPLPAQLHPLDPDELVPPGPPEAGVAALSPVELSPVERAKAPADRRRLRGRTIPVVALDDPTRARMWRIFERYYVDVTPERFRSDLDAKHSVILLEDARDGSLQGFSTIQVLERELEGRRFRAIYSGDTVLETGYWGQGALRRAFVRFMFLQKLRRPFTPLYWFLLSKGYRTYLLMARNVVRFWPRHGQATPAREARRLDLLAREKFGDAWNPASGVVQFDQCLGRVRPGVVPLPPELRDDPDVRFFHQANPGHADGDELCCLGRLELVTCLWSALKFARGLWPLRR